METISLTAERRSTFELQQEQHMRLAAVRSSILQTTRKLAAARALSLDPGTLWEELEVLFTVEAREATTLGEMLACPIQ